MRLKGTDQGGMALVMVMWTLVLLMVFAAELAVSARSDVRAVLNFKEDRQEYFLANAGIEMAFNEILSDSDYQFLSDSGQIVFARAGDESHAPQYTPRAGIKMGGGEFSYVIRDENGKLNLNELARDQARLKLLFELLFPTGVEGGDTALDSIMDWADPNESHRANGAKSDYYRTLVPPYTSKDGDFDTVYELRRVKGVSPSIWSTLSGVVTAFPTGTLNTNTASKTALLAKGIPPDQVEAILADRARKGFSDITGKSDVFEITSSGRFQGSRQVRTIRVYVKKTGPRSLTVLEWNDNYYESPPLQLKEKRRGELLAGLTP